METISTDTENIESKIKTLLEFIGDKPNREGLVDTPKRMIKAWREMLYGYTVTDYNTLLSRTFSEDIQYDQMIIVKNINFVSFCEHHWLPFLGKAHFGYLPKDNVVVGLSKIPRLIKTLAAQLQIQERLTQEITDIFSRHVNPLGCGVMVEAVHQCMACRGAQAFNSSVVTTSLTGIFRNVDVKTEFLSSVR